MEAVDCFDKFSCFFAAIALPPLFLLQNAQALVQKYLIALLNNKGRELISATMRQRKGNNLYPPGAEPLKDPVADYSSLTGSDKWLLASIVLLVFRAVFHTTATMVSSYLHGVLVLSTASKYAEVVQAR